MLEETKQQNEEMIQKNPYMKYIKPAFDKLYKNDLELFDNNLCERCIVFRFAYHLQNKFNNYFVDCDYNSSTYFDKESRKWKRKKGKPIPDSEQNKAKIKKRFIDIIVHKRDSYKSNLICFEIKKWNNCSKKDSIRKDENNLKVLTLQYGYKYGFHLIFGKNKKETLISIFKDGKKFVNQQKIDKI